MQTTSEILCQTSHSPAPVAPNAVQGEDDLWIAQTQSKSKSKCWSCTVCCLWFVTEAVIPSGILLITQYMILFLRSSLSYKQRSGNIRATIAHSLIILSLYSGAIIEFRRWIQRWESNCKRVLLLNEFIYANEGKPREITQVVSVTQIIMKDYTYN